MSLDRGPAFNAAVAMPSAAPVRLRLRFDPQKHLSDAVRVVTSILGRLDALVA